MRKLIALLAVLSLTALLSVAAGAGAADDQPQARAAATKVAKVRDNFFSARCKEIKRLLTCTVNKNDIVEWRWTADAGATETNEHNVKGFYASGTRKGRLAFGSSNMFMAGDKYRKKFRSAGASYNVLCTLHASNMRMKVVVRR